MMTKARQFAQPGLFVDGAAAGHSLQWSLTGDPARVRAVLAALDPHDAVIGLGAPLVAALGGSVPGLKGFQALDGTVSMPSTQTALWAYITDATPGGAFARAETLESQLAGLFQLEESLPLFRYRDGRDLTGYLDGTANPEGDDADEAALIPNGDLAGGSFALVQRYLHYRSRFDRLAQSERDAIVGRRLSDNEEMEDAPETSHVKRTDQEGYEQPAFMLRRSMPWGTLLQQGLQFVAYTADLAVMDLVLRRMCGLVDGQVDALLRYTEAESGAYFYCPPIKNGRLNLTGL